MALRVSGATLHRTLALGPPEAEVLGVIGVLAPSASLASVLLLPPARPATEVRPVWPCPRGDAIGDGIVMPAVPGVRGTETAWPACPAGVMAGLLPSASVQILRRARAERRRGGRRADGRAGT